MGIDWTKEEVEFIVADYFEMLAHELNNKKYKKSAHREKLGKQLNNRDSAIEYKHRNISGVLAEMGLPFIKGYKPLFNYQQLLAEEVIETLEDNKSFFEKGFQRFSEEVAIPVKKKIDFSKIIENSPSKAKLKENEPLFRPIKINYLAREQNNRILGESGESLVLDYEKWRLEKEGKESLIDKIEWVSKEKGDGLGFDILSKNRNGTDRYIEVKTTKLSKETPIYLSQNELHFSIKMAKGFYLYRVFNFKEDPRLFIKQGSYENFCQLKPQSYKGFF